MELEEIQDYCEFGPDRAYIMMAIARSKENDEIRATDQPTIRKIIEDETEIGEKREQLEHAVSRFDNTYRLYLTINARSTTDAFFLFRQEQEQWLKNIAFGNKNSLTNLKKIDHRWKSFLHKQPCRDDKLFLFDMDDATEEDADKLSADLAEETRILLKNPSPNGWHIITEPFNYTEFESEHEYELKKDGMMFLGFAGDR